MPRNTTISDGKVASRYCARPAGHVRRRAQPFGRGAPVLVPQAPVLVAGFREVLWLRPTARSRCWRRAKRAAGSRAIRRCCAMRAPPRGGSIRRGSPRSTCWSCSPLSGRRGSACRRRAGSPRRSGCRRRAARPRPASPWRPRRAHCSRRWQADDAECRAIAEAMDRGGWLWAPAVLAALSRG